MDVILLEKMPKLGKPGDVVRVKDGYGRNFLIPYGKAKRATDKTIAEFEARRVEFEKAASDKLAAAQVLGEKLSSTTVSLNEKAAVDGRLFGSVTNHAIVAALNQANLSVGKTQIHMPNGALKTTGEHSVIVSLHPDVVVHVKVVIVGETA